MSTRNDALFAMQEVTQDHSLALRALRYFFAKYPGQAIASLEEIKVTPAGSVLVNVPTRRDSSGYGWNGGSYTVPRNILTGFWNTDPGNRKVEAIKYLRAKLGIGLKEAKDLMEYLWETHIGK